MKTFWIFTLAGAALGAGLWLLFLCALAWVWGIGGGVAFAVIAQPAQMRVFLLAGFIGGALGFSIWLITSRSRTI